MRFLMASFNQLIVKIYGKLYYFVKSYIYRFKIKIRSIKTFPLQYKYGIFKAGAWCYKYGNTDDVATKVMKQYMVVLPGRNIFKFVVTSNAKELALFCKTSFSVFNIQILSINILDLAKQINVWATYF